MHFYHFELPASAFNAHLSQHDHISSSDEDVERYNAIADQVILETLRPKTPYLIYHFLALLDYAGCTQTRLAKLLEISPVTLSHILHARRSASDDIARALLVLALRMDSTEEWTLELFQRA